MRRTYPGLDFQPRVTRDIDEATAFIARQPRGHPEARRRDIYAGIEEIVRGPTLNDIGFRRRDTGIELRRHNAAQFAIIYAYYPPNPAYPRGLVSIRAVRHSRVKNVFRGVREAARQMYAAG